MRVHAIRLVLLATVLGAVLALAPGAAEASCNCDDEVEVLCTTFAVPPDAGPDDGGAALGERCCEFCLGDEADECLACVDPVDPADAAEPAGSDDDDRGCAASGAHGLSGTLLLVAAFALTRRRRPRRG